MRSASRKAEPILPPAGDVWFQEVAKPISTADMRRKAVIHGFTYGNLLRDHQCQFLSAAGPSLRSSAVREGHGIALWVAAVAPSRYHQVTGPFGTHRLRFMPVVVCLMPTGRDRVP